MYKLNICLLSVILVSPTCYSDVTVPSKQPVATKQSGMSPSAGIDAAVTAVTDAARLHIINKININNNVTITKGVNKLRANGHTGKTYIHYDTTGRATGVYKNDTGALSGRIVEGPTIPKVDISAHIPSATEKQAELRRAAEAIKRDNMLRQQQQQMLQFLQQQQQQRIQQQLMQQQQQQMQMQLQCGGCRMG